MLWFADSGDYCCYWWVMIVIAVWGRLTHNVVIARATVCAMCLCDSVDWCVCCSHIVFCNVWCALQVPESGISCKQHHKQIACLSNIYTHITNNITSTSDTSNMCDVVICDTQITQTRSTIKLTRHCDNVRQTQWTLTLTFMFQHCNMCVEQHCAHTSTTTNIDWFQLVIKHASTQQSHSYKHTQTWHVHMLICWQTYVRQPWYCRMQQHTWHTHTHLSDTVHVWVCHNNNATLRNATLMLWYAN